MRCYINQMTHFDIIVIFRDERIHTILKKQLSISTNDFKTMINDIKLMLICQINEHYIAIEQVQLRSSLKFSRFIVLNEIVTHITSYVLRLIASEHRKFIDAIIIFNRCTRVFFTTLKLSCSHKIQKRLF